MAQQISCPGCRTVYKLVDNPQGKSIKIKCRKCGRVFASGGAGSTDIQAGKKPAPSSKSSPTPPRTGKAPARKSKMPIVLILVGLVFLVGLGGAGALVGGYFLLYHRGQETTKLAQDQQPAPDAEGRKADKKDDKLKPGPDPKEKKVDPLPDPKEKKVDPPPDPKEKKVDPLPDPKEKKIDPLPDPKEKKIDPPPPVVVGLYKLKDPPTPPVEIKLPESAAQMVLTPDGKTAVVSRNALANNERNILVVELPSGKVIKNVPIPGLAVKSLVLTPDAKFVLIGGMDDRFNVQPKDRVHIWTLSLATGQYVGVVKGPTQGIDAMALSPDGNTLACAESSFGGPRGCIRVLNPKTGVTLFYKEKVHLNVTHGIALTADKKYVVSAGVDNDGKCKVVVFDIAAKTEKHVLTGFPGAAEGLAVSGDGRLVAAAINGGNGGSVRIWDIETGVEKLALVAKGGRGGRHVLFGPEDKSIIATFYDESTRTFNLETGHEEGGFRGHSITPNSLVKSADGRILVTAYFKDVRVWQFPDSLMKLGKADQPAFVDIVRDGKAIAVKDPVKPPEVVPAHIAVIDAIEGKNDLVVLMKGATSRVTLRPDTKFFDAAGKPVPAVDAGRVYRLGNQVTLQMHNFFKGAVAEMRLVKEGPAEIIVENARQIGSGFPIFIFAVPGKELRAKLSSDVRYVDHEGKPTSAKDGKFFNSEDVYALKLRLEVGEDAPILVEVRLTPAKGDLPVFLKYPLGMVGAKAIKNAVFKRIEVNKTSVPHLLVAGAEPIPIFTNNETKIYDMKGNPPGPGQSVFDQEVKVDAVIVARGKSNLLLEARALAPFPPPPPVVKKIVDHANVAISRPAGNTRQAFLKPVKGQSILVALDPNLKAFDKEGKAIAADRVFQAGVRIDAKIEEAGPQRTLIEARLVDEPLAAGKRTFEDIEVLKGGGKVYTLKIGNKNVNALVFKETKFFDADGKPSTADQVLRAGSKVDVVIDIRPNPNVPSPLLEARAAKRK